MARKKRHRQGHYCAVCGFNRPNEAFSGGGHKDHCCRECSKLDADERVFRREANNLDHLLRWEAPTIPKNKRQQFESFLRHENERVRRYAQKLLAEDRAERALLLAIRLRDDGAFTAYKAAIDRRLEAAGAPPREGVADDYDEIDPLLEEPEAPPDDDDAGSFAYRDDDIPF
jgi:hypothetical protein